MATVEIAREFGVMISPATIYLLILDRSLETPCTIAVLTEVRTNRILSFAAAPNVRTLDVVPI